MFRRTVISVASAVVLSSAMFAAGSGALSSAGAQAQPAAVPRIKNISISSTCTSTLFCFVPMKKSVASGVQVVWTNNTGAPHQLALCTVAACGVSSGTGTDTGYGSPVLSGGQSYAFTFHALGTYTYYCTIHGYATMHGTITVEAAPTITSVMPSTIARGANNVSVTVKGTNFHDGIKAMFSGTGVTVSSVVRTSNGKLTLTVSATSTAHAGQRRLTLTNTDGGGVVKAQAISVT